MKDLKKGTLVLEMQKDSDQDPFDMNADEEVDIQIRHTISQYLHELMIQFALAKRCIIDFKRVAEQEEDKESDDEEEEESF